MPIIPEWEMRTMIGGTGSMVITGITGSVQEFTYEEYDRMMANGTWQGGMVGNMGYIGSTIEYTVIGETGITGSSGYNSSIAYGAGAGTGYSEPPAISGGGGSTYNPYAKNDITIIAPKGTLSDKARRVLNEALLKCKDQSITITSILRDQRDQARAMVDWLQKEINKGLTTQQAIAYLQTNFYTSTKGRAIIQSYNPQLSIAQNYNILEAKIKEIGFTSPHMMQSDRTTFDIGMSSINNSAELIKAIKEVDPTAKVINEQGNCLHVEILK